MNDALKNLDEISEYLKSVSYLLYSDQQRLSDKLDISTYKLLINELENLVENINNQHYIIEEYIKNKKVSAVTEE